MDWCDYVVCRSGALTISEVSSMSKGALMIPLPNAIDNHQLFNAEHIMDSQYGHNSPRKKWGREFKKPS